LSHVDFGFVIPAQAGIQCPSVDSRLRGNDAPLFFAPTMQSSCSSADFSEDFQFFLPKNTIAGPMNLDRRQLQVVSKPGLAPDAGSVLPQIQQLHECLSRF
jgi:hypothetical protein